MERMRTGPRSASAATALVRRRARDGGDEKALYAGAGIVHLLFGEAGVDDVHNAVNRQRRLGDVGRDDDFAPGGAPRRCLRRVFKDALLLLRGQRRVQR